MLSIIGEKIYNSNNNLKYLRFKREEILIIVLPR